MSLADKIIKIRLDNNLSKEEFANELFVTVMDVEKWEQGYSVPDEGMLNVIAFKFNVPFDYLLEKKVENNFSDVSKKPLGIRSNAFCVSSIFGLVILSFAMVFMIMALITAEEDFPFMIIFILIFGGISIYFLYTVISTLKKPKVIIEYDDYGIYLNHLKGLFIPYESIIKCKVRHARSKHHVHHYGDIIIETDNGTYKVGVIDELDEVLHTIMSHKFTNIE